MYLSPTICSLWDHCRSPKLLSIPLVFRELLQFIHTCTCGRGHVDYYSVHLLHLPSFTTYTLPFPLLFPLPPLLSLSPSIVTDGDKGPPNTAVDQQRNRIIAAAALKDAEPLADKGVITHCHLYNVITLTMYV